jgi:hypothetical protein
MFASIFAGPERNASACRLAARQSPRKQRATKTIFETFALKQVQMTRFLRVSRSEKLPASAERQEEEI